jgi:ubiquinone/menaquinone biosynthesis C-methylase UbiE
MSPSVEAERQAAFHQRLFTALFQWDEVWHAALELAGDQRTALRLGLDQLGHFGAPGVDLVADRFVGSAHGQPTRVLELGSGFGGALRQIGRRLNSVGMHPTLVGVELVREHCKLATVVGRTAGDQDMLITNADAARLPFCSNSMDGVFAVGSASHFMAMKAILGECGRVLAPQGVLVMMEEVSLRPRGAPPPSPSFVAHHPTEAFFAATPEQRRDDLRAAGFEIEVFQSLHDWALPLLRQRIRAFQLLGSCALQIFGSDACPRIIGTLQSAADEYEHGSIEPMLIVARPAAS